MKVSKAFEQAVKEYLDALAKKDELFAKSYAKEGKSITNCCKFICGEVQKMKVNGLTDDEVFALAAHYYDEDNVKVSDVACTVVVNHQIELTEDEKKELREKAKADYYQTALARQREAMTQPKKVAAKEDTTQLSLF